MNQHDEELQRKLEAGELPASGTIDEKAYEVVFSALRREPGYRLPEGFAARVAARASARQNKTVLSDYLWLAAGILVLLASCVIALALTGLRLDFSFLKTLSGYKGMLLFGAAVIAALNWIDRKLVKEHLQHRS